MSSSSSRRRDPLTEVLLCATTGRPVDLSPPPAILEQPHSPRTKAVAAMTRSRTAILSGARRAVLDNGTKITMSQIATEAGVAKATLYNHFRTLSDVLQALMIDEIERLVQEFGHLQLAPALIAAAEVLSDHPLLEALSAQDTDVLAALARVDVRSPGWAMVATSCENILSRSGRRGLPTVLRWLSSFVLAPAEREDIRADVDVLVAGLPPAGVDGKSTVVSYERPGMRQTVK